MNDKKIFSYLLIVMLMAFFAYLVLGEFTYYTIDKQNSTLKDGKNISGSNFNLTIYIGNSSGGMNRNETITNMSIMWQLKSNNSFMANYTYNNISVNQSTWGNNSNTSVGTTFFNTAALPDGVYNISIMIINFSNAGLGGGGQVYVNHSIFVNITIDNTKPAVVINGPATSGVTYNHSSGNVTFNISVADLTIQTAANSVAYGLVIFEFDNASGNNFNTSGDGSGAPVNQSGYWSMGINVSALHAGTHIVIAHVNDTASNGSLANYNRTQIWTFNVNTPENVTVLTVGGNPVTGQNFSAINSTNVFNLSVINNTHEGVINAVILMFNNASGADFNVSASNQGGTGWYWNASYNVSALEEGNHIVTVFANDTTGNFNRTEKVTFVVDKTAPVITVTCTSAPTVGDTVTCTCVATDSITDVRVGPFIGSGSSITETTTATGTVPVTSSICTATDRVGNIGTGTGSWTPVAASVGGGGASGGGGGQSSGVTGTFAKEVWTSINAGETAKVEVTNGAIGVTEVSFSVADTTYGAWLKVEKKDSLPGDVQSFSGKVYKNIEITESNVKKALTGTAKIEFKVTKVWLSENGLGKTDVAMHRYADGKWNELKTTVGEDDGTYQYYTAETSGFSYFVIGQKSGAVAGPAKEAAAEKVAGEKAAAGEEAVGEEAAAGEEVVAGEGKGIWTWVIVIFVIIALIAIAFWLKKR